MTSFEKNRRTRPARGFTLIEMLAVVFIIGLLLAIAFPVLNRVRNNAWRTRAHQEAQQVAQAWNAYLLDQRSWPDNANSIDRMDRETCELLNDITTYLEIDEEMAPYGYLDPWGLRALKQGNEDGAETWQIRVALDTDYDGEVDYHGDPVRRSAIAWSVGPDGLDSDEGPHAMEDNVTSW